MLLLLTYVQPYTFEGNKGECNFIFKLSLTHLNFEQIIYQISVHLSPLSVSAFLKHIVITNMWP